MRAVLTLIGPRLACLKVALYYTAAIRSWLARLALTIFNPVVFLAADLLIFYYKARKGQQDGVVKKECAYYTTSVFKNACRLSESVGRN